MKLEAGITNRVAKAIALMSVIVFAVGAAMSAAPSFVCAQAVPATCPNFGLERTTTYDLQGAAYAYGYAVATDGANNTYVTGEQYAPATGLDMFVIKYDQNGNVVWSDVYDNAGGNESGYGVVVTANGSAVYVVGRQQDNASLNSDAFVRKYAYNAATDTYDIGWTQIYNGPSGGADIARGAALDSDGNIYAAGYREKVAGGIEAMLLSYTAAGVLRWGGPVAYTATYNASAFGVAVAGSNVYMTGYTQPTINDTDMFVQKYTTGGVSGWGQTYNSTSDSQTEIGYGVAVEAGGNVFVTGYQDTNGGDSFIRKYDPAGALVWEGAYNSGGTQNDVGRGVVAGNSGRIFVAGRQQTNAEDAFLNEYYKDDTNPNNNFPPGTGSVQSGGVVGPAECGGDPSGDMWYSCSWAAPAYCQTPYGVNTPAAGNCGASIPMGQSGSTSRYNGDAGAPTVYPCPPGYSVVAGVCYNPTILVDTFLADFLYKGDQAGAPEYGEMAFGVARTNSTVPVYAATSDDVYVIGYQALNGGEAFLNKYSCNAAQKAAVGASLIANFTATPTSGPDPLTVNVDARASAGTIAKYEWDWSYDVAAGFNNEGTGALASHIYTIPGAYTIALRITTSSNTTDIATRVINVSANSAPTAEFKTCDLKDANCIASTSGMSFTGVAPLRVNVDGAASTDPNALQGGYVKSFSWNWGDGTIPGVGEKATHLYSAPGPYTITLTVTDNGGLTNAVPATQAVSVVAQYVCTSGAGVGGSCVAPTPVCGPTETVGVTQCYACLADNNCGAGYQCLGTPCTAGTQCSDGALCPADGKCPEIVTCNPLASGATCPDSSLCPVSGICPAAKNICTLSGSAVDTDCYIEEQGSCVINADCTESITGGVCDTASGACRYARCSNDTALACITDNDCASGDGICNSGSCVYIYDCAYGPGLGGGVAGLYATSTPDVMPKMPLGVQPDGQACTQPTPDAPNNCEGINGCLYYNYYSGSGTAIPNSNNSVANCVNTFEGGTGCVYYQYYDGATQTQKANCLPRYAEKSKKSPQAGIPDGCFVVDKGKAGKEYDCSSVNGCYYYLDGRVDCTYVNATAETCTASTVSTSCVSQPLAIATCGTTTSLCEYQGNGCIYEPNPKGAISCPGATSPATGGDNFVQCMLNPDGVLPGFLNTGGNALSSCSVNADCPVDNICLNGTCYPACQANVDCASGEQCTTTCITSLDCTAGLVCNAGVCVPPLCAGGTPAGTLVNVTSANLGLVTSTDSNCRYSIDSAAPYTAMTPFATTNTTSHSEPLSGLSVGSYAYYVLCQELSSGVLAGLCQINFDITAISCIPGTICPNGAVCPASGICPATVPACAGAFPTGELPFGTTSTTMGLTTAQDAACSYSLVAIDSYASMTPFSTTGATSHSTNVSGLLIGTNTYYAKCQDTASGAITNACAISFGVGTACTSSAMCASGLMCINGTCQPPVCANAAPTGALAPGTTSTTISLTTDADANCRYSTNGGDAYGAMTDFATTGSTNHSSFVSGLVTGGNTHYVRCQDVVTSAEKFCQIPFSVGVCNQEYKCETGWQCIPNIGNGICTPLVGCTPGTICASGVICPVNGVCPPPVCVAGDLLCPAGGQYCPQGAIYNAITGECDYAAWADFCAVNPTHPLCVGGPDGGGPGGIVLGIASCNTLGYTFTGTAITPSGNCDLVAIILALLSWMAWIIALLAVLSGLRAAYLYITAMGDEKNLILARRYLIYTTIGVAVAVFTFSIVAITRAILNI
ncbi:PKD domain-containing protein [Candidatus Azambacteria bacterium]|nr:PKD domain-containing protein [Candidatus Azambacteria bacterium]